MRLSPLDDRTGLTAALYRSRIAFDILQPRLARARSPAEMVAVIEDIENVARSLNVTLGLARRALVNLNSPTS